MNGLYKLSISFLLVVLIFSCSNTEKMSKVSTGSSASISDSATKRSLIPTSYYFDFSKFKNRFPYQKLKVYRISDTLVRTGVIDSKEFYDIFQIFTESPPTEINECGCANREQIFPASAYFLGYHGRLKQRYLDRIQFDFITVLVENTNGSQIHWLVYPDKSIDKNRFDFRKGVNTKKYLAPVLAEKYKNETFDFESYSEFLDNKIIKKTSISKNLKTQEIETTIEVFELYFNDMSVLCDEAKFRNDSLITGFINTELRQEYQY